MLISFTSYTVLTVTSVWWGRTSISESSIESVSALCVWPPGCAPGCYDKTWMFHGKDTALQWCICGLWWLEDLMASQRCRAAPVLKLPPVRTSANLNPSLWLRPPPFLHPSICYTLPICFHLSARCSWACSLGGKNGSGQQAEAGTYSLSGIRKVLSTISFQFLCLWNGDSETASCTLETQLLGSYKMLNIVQMLSTIAANSVAA